MATATDAAATSSEATRMDDASERAPLATADPAYGHDVEAGDTAHVAAADSSGAAAAAVDTGVGEGGLGSGHVVERVSERAPAKVGNTILLFAAASDHYDAKWFPRKCIVGPDWPCLSYTYALLIVPNMLHILFVADDYALVFQILAYAVFIFAVCALSFTACSDPGILKRQSLEYAQDQQIQGKRGNYCSECALGLALHGCARQAEGVVVAVRSLHADHALTVSIAYTLLVVAPARAVLQTSAT